MEARKLEIEEFLKNKVNPLLEPLTIEIIKQRPESISDFCLKWLEKQSKKISTKDRHQDAEHSTEEDDQPIEEENLQVRRSKNAKRSRSGVSAEAYGEYNKKEQFVPPVYEKSEETKMRILILVNKSILFKGLEEKNVEIVIGAMEEKVVRAGDTIIKEGDGGNALYIVDEGEFECYKKIGDQDTYLKTYQVGDAFGELALLYNAPRAATIKAKTDGKLFSLQRNTFNNIVKNSAVQRKQLYEQTLKKVELLDSVDSYERTQICDVLKESKYGPGEYVIRQGDTGDKFYIVVDGKLIAERTDNGVTNIVYQYKNGDYFGQIALVRNIPRQASVKTLTSSTIVSIDRSAFKRLLGPIQEILKRNEQRYTKFWKFEQTNK